MFRWAVGNEMLPVDRLTRRLRPWRGCAKGRTEAQGGRAGRAGAEEHVWAVHAVVPPQVRR